MPLVPGNSLITETPEEGRELAIMLSRKSVVAREFATVAAANNCWRD